MISFALAISFCFVFFANKYYLRAKIGERNYFGIDGLVFLALALVFWVVGEGASQIFSIAFLLVGVMTFGAFLLWDSENPSARKWVEWIRALDAQLK